MKKKIYISPSNQVSNRYAVGNTNEAEQCRKIATKLVEALNRCGFESLTNVTGDMYEHVRESNTFGADLHIPIHTNAYNGKVAGLRIFVYKTGGEAERIAKAISAELAPITPGTSDGISAQPRLYECKATNALCVYIEAGFHDNPTEAQWIIDHTVDIAEAICRGLCKHYGVTYVTSSAPEPAPVPKTAECSIKLPVLRKGSQGTSVRALQSLLIGCGYLCGVWGADGDFGAATDETLRKFQKNVGIVSDGIAGADTWSKLLKG